jgi:hypothetical protein
VNGLEHLTGRAGMPVDLRMHQRGPLPIGTLHELGTSTCQCNVPRRLVLTSGSTFDTSGRGVVIVVRDQRRNGFVKLGH